MFNFEFKIIEFIQKFRTPVLDEFFKFLNFFDKDLFYFIFIPIVWIGYNRKLGTKLFFIIILSSIVNNLLKNIFMVPRPHDIYPYLGIIKLKTYSFPSGATQFAILLPLIFIHHFKNPKIIIAGSLYFFFISFSRMYLGVHFLSDVITGWIIGFLLFLVYLYIFPKIETYVVKKPALSFWICQSSILILLFIPGLTRQVFAILGVLLGLFLSTEFHMFLNNVKRFKEFFIRSFLAIFGIFFIYGLYYFLHKKVVFIDLNFISYLMGFWISFLCSFIYKKIFFKNNRIRRI